MCWTVMRSECKEIILLVRSEEDCSEDRKTRISGNILIDTLDLIWDTSLYKALLLLYYSGYIIL